MIDWKQSLPTIIAAIIGSGLIVTAFSTISSAIFKPLIDVNVKQILSGRHFNVTTYTISLRNIGNAPATHLRLTMYYPGAKILPTIEHQVDENMTIKNQTGTSVVAFLPRLTPNAIVSIDTSIWRNINTEILDSIDTEKCLKEYPYLARTNDTEWRLNCLSLTEGAAPFVDYSTNQSSYIYPHDSPYSIVATYDQGIYDYTPPSRYLPIFDIFSELYIFPPILIALAFLGFGIALRHKTRSRSKFASDILTDVMKVRNELDNDKGDPSGIILRLHAWQSNADNERKVVSDYRDYQNKKLCNTNC